MKGYKILLLFLILSGVTAYSQQLSRQVLVPLAGLASGNNLSYSQTVGETAVQIASCSEYIFTEGFQQPGFRLKSEIEPQGTVAKVYPNPVNDFVTIELHGDASRTFKIDFINIAGTIVISERKVFNDKFWYKDLLNLESLARGFYLIRIYSEDGMVNQTFKIEKL